MAEKKVSVRLVAEGGRRVRAELEAQDRASPAQRLIDDLPLFAASRAPSPAQPSDPAAGAVLAALTALNPNDLSPKQALEALYALKQTAKKQA